MTAPSDVWSAIEQPIFMVTSLVASP